MYMFHLLVSQKNEAFRECVQAQTELSGTFPLVLGTKALLKCAISICSELKKRLNETRQEAERMAVERELQQKNRQLLEEMIQSTEAKNTA